MQGIALTMGNDFKKARFNLVVLYLIIIGTVISLFSLLIIYQAKNSFQDPAVSTNKDLMLSASEALVIAKNIRPGKEVRETEYEIEQGKLYFTVAFNDEVTEVKVDLLTGETYIPEGEHGIIHMLTNDFDEKVLWIALLVFMFAASLCIFVANKTLNPISLNIRKQQQFVSGAAHELRNPLAALHARIESILRSTEQELKEDVLGDLLSETKHLIALSEDLLSLEKGEFKASDVKVTSPKIYVDQVVRRLEHLAEDKHITIQRDIGTELLAIDAEDLLTILYNLLHNALKFTKNGGTVTVVWTNKTLTVSDSGIGIPKDEIPSIFDRFYKVDASRGHEGSGLGLSLVKEIAQRYGASVTVDSEVGKGTTFTVKFR